MAYHAWVPVVGYENGGVRTLWTATVRFAEGLPTLS